MKGVVYITQFIEPGGMPAIYCKQEIFESANFRINGLIALRINFHSINFRMVEKPDYAYAAQN